MLKTSDMKISIITATYNSEQVLARCIDSVNNQTFQDIEHVFVDGASKDGTVQLIESSSKFLTKYVSESDKGIYDAMNKGVGLVSGDIVGILNSDDYYADEDVLKEVVAQFENAAVDAVYGDLQYVDETGKVVRDWKSGVYEKSNFLKGWMPPHPAFFVRKSVYDKYGLFNLDLKSAADYEFMLRVLFKEGVSCAYLPKLLVKMQTGGQSNASLGNRWKAHLEDRKAWALNGLKPKAFTLIMKPLSKISQFF